VTQPHVILLGLPGSGKSSVGAGVAERIGRPFVDFDVEIERREGMSVARIFQERGEAAFRKLELELTRELAQGGGMILAPGGGWITVPGAMALLRPPARMIYLRVTPDVALQRMGAARANRPLLRAPDPAAELVRLLEKREPLYLLADHVVDVDLLDLQRVITLVGDLATTFQAG
jgi:shikimate kinase